MAFWEFFGLGLFISAQNMNAGNRFGATKRKVSQYSDIGCGHYKGIPSTDQLCRLCILSLHREVGGVRQSTLLKTAVNCSESCGAATTMTLNFCINRKVLTHINK